MENKENGRLYGFSWKVKYVDWKLNITDLLNGLNEQIPIKRKFIYYRRLNIVAYQNISNLLPIRVR